MSYFFCLVKLIKNIDTVRVMENNAGPDFDNPEGTEHERPEEPMHYRNCYAQDAPSYFRHLIEKVRSLELIPTGPSRWDKEFYGYNSGFEEVSTESHKTGLAN